MSRHTDLQTAVLFAGGQSSRMGKDKSLLPFGGYKTLSEFQVKRLSKLFRQVYISTKEEKFGFETALIYDIYPDSSPLIGLVSIFEQLNIEECFVLSVDAPFVDQETIRKIHDESGKRGFYDAVIARSPGGTQPLCGIYRRSILPLAKQFIKEEKHRLNALLNEAETFFVDFENEEIFLNLNHPHEYNKAVSLHKKD